MRMRIYWSIAFVALIVMLSAAAPARADNYIVDNAHSGVVFRVQHMGISWTHGRFNDVAGTFTIDAGDPAKSSFTMTMKTQSIDTGNKARDQHLTGPDFFNAKQYPTIAFKSTSVKPGKDGYEVTGDMTMHGVTKPITFALTGGKTAEMQGMKRIGFSTDFAIKRSDFGISKFLEGVGDEVFISVSFEGTKK